MLFGLYAMVVNFYNLNRTAIEGQQYRFNLTLAPHKRETYYFYNTHTTKCQELKMNP
ncbi:hypothetical protein NUACC21_27180 [Scytonema sp. NUACC21]